MGAIVLGVRVALTAVFAAAGIAKLQDLQTSRNAVAAFGIPAAYARFAGSLLPFVELGTAVALMPQASARGGAVAACTLLSVFTAAVAIALARGRTPSCNCFGQVSAEPISRWTIVRNGVLLGLAAFATWKGPGASLGRWTATPTVANVVAALAVILFVLAAICAAHYRAAAADLRKRLGAGGRSGTEPDAALAVGEVAPEFALSDLGGETVTLELLLERDLPAVLVFASPICGPCRALVPELVAWGGSLSERLTLALVESTVASREDLAHDMPSQSELLTLFETGVDVASAYRIRQTPTAIAIDRGGSVAGGPAIGAGAIEELVRATLRLEAPSLTRAA